MEIKNHPGCADRGLAPTGKDPCDKFTQRHPNLKLKSPPIHIWVAFLLNKIFKLKHH